MKTYSYRTDTSVYVEGDVDVSLEDFEISLSDIHHSQQSNYFSVDVELIPKSEELKQVMQALDIGTSTTRSTFRKKYDYRGRRTEKQRQEAKDEAKESLIKAVNSGKYEKRILHRIEDKLENRIEYNNREYINSVKNDFVDHDYLNWDSVKDDELEETQEEIDDLERQIKILKEKKRKAKERKRTRKNKLFLEYLNEEGLDGMFNVDYPEKAKEMIRDMAENNELFNLQSYDFLG